MTVQELLEAIKDAKPSMEIYVVPGWAYGSGIENIEVGDYSVKLEVGGMTWQQAEY